MSGLDDEYVKDREIVLLTYALIGAVAGVVVAFVIMGIIVKLT